MPGDYVLCEYEDVRKTLGEFKETMDKLASDLIAHAEAKWAPLKYGGIKAKKGQFSKTTIMPQLFAGMTGATLTTWRQLFNATGAQTILTGAASGGVIYEDYMVGFCGIAFLDPVLRISEIKMQVSDKKLPRINIEEAMAYEKPAIIFEEGFILDEETGFTLDAYVLTQGYQRFKLIGMQLNRVPNKLQITNTGAALT